MSRKVPCPITVGPARPVPVRRGNISTRAVGIGPSPSKPSSSPKGRVRGRTIAFRSRRRHTTGSLGRMPRKTRGRLPPCSMSGCVHTATSKPETCPPLAGLEPRAARTRGRRLIGRQLQFGYVPVIRGKRRQHSSTGLQGRIELRAGSTRQSRSLAWLPERCLCSTPNVDVMIVMRIQTKCRLADGNQNSHFTAKSCWRSSLRRSTLLIFPRLAALGGSGEDWSRHGCR